MDVIINLSPLLIGWILDLIFGDPARLPHPVVWFGNAISGLEHRFNKGSHRKIKGASVAVFLIVGVFVVTWLFLRFLSPLRWLDIAVQSILVFYCLAGTTLIREVRMTFAAVDESLESGRRQVGRIVGRDTSGLTAQEIRTAALETLAENLSDGVIAPLFWYAVLGVPGMMAYKMVNTLDSMIGYRNSRYRDFGCVAARIDDVANYIPARLTAFLMVVVSGKLRLLRFVRKYGSRHLSPNSGYPEAALAGILDCRFGGPHDYFGENVDKPFIGEDHRDFNSIDARKAISINRRAEILAILLTVIVRWSILLLSRTAGWP
ncbi:MAG: adenosylcobinamide-phosphate synthase CbiB [Muribaculaceae bacterium]|nr:adenosylcobinamide-phosphate synthase CbiB [Muribaculaceae bacterium]